MAEVHRSGEALHAVHAIRVDYAVGGGIRAMRRNRSRVKGYCALAAALLGTAFVPAVEGALPVDEVVWSGAGESDWVNLGVDSSGYPHCAWVGHSGAYGIYYLRWNGEEWVDADGSGQESACVYSTTATLYYLTMKVDSSQSPHIAWTDNHLYGSYGYDVYYLRWSGSAWTDADGTGQESANMSLTADGSYFGWCSVPSLGTDTTCRPHIAWYCNDTGLGQGWYLRWNGVAWVDLDGSGRESPIIYAGSRGAGIPTMRLDLEDSPHAAWSAYAAGAYTDHYDVYYLRASGASWVDADGSGTESADVSNTAPYSYSYDPEIAVDASCRAHLFWREGASGLWYWRWNGSIWADVDGSSLESTVVTEDEEMRTRDLVFDTAGLPVIEYYAARGSSVSAVYCLRWNGAEWTDLDGSGTESAVLPTGDATAALGTGPGGAVHYAWIGDDAAIRHSYARDYPRADASSPETGSPALAFAYALTDPSSADCRIEAAYSADGGSTYQPATGGEGGDGTEELASSPSGTPHAFVWNAFEDLGLGAYPGVRFRITPFDADGRGMRGCTEAFDVDFSDSDGDGLADIEEDSFGSDPSLADTDVDGLSDYEEIMHDGARTSNPRRALTNPSGTDTDFANPDTDGDGYSDLVEIAGGTDPLVSRGVPETVRISFRPGTAARPQGFATDSGWGYDGGRGYGWE
jgi:hypothetical protein